jgi:hypothetical protein
MQIDTRCRPAEILHGSLKHTEYQSANIGLQLAILACLEAQFLATHVLSVDN